MATAKHKSQQLLFNPEKQRLNNFLAELWKLTNDAIGVAAQLIIEQFLHAKMTPHPKNSIKQAHLENEVYKQIVSHLCRQLELSVFEAPDELQVKTVTQQSTKSNLETFKQACHHCKRPGYYRNQCSQLKREENKAKINTKGVGNKNNDEKGQTNINPSNQNNSNTNTDNANNRLGRKSGTVYPLCETCGKTNHPTEKCYFRANAASGLPPRSKSPEGHNQVQQRDNQKIPNQSAQDAAQTLN